MAKRGVKIGVGWTRTGCGEDEPLWKRGSTSTGWGAPAPSERGRVATGRSGQTRTGASAPAEGVLPMTAEETRAYLDRLNTVIAAMDSDIKSQFVWANPKEVYKQIHPDLPAVGGARLPACEGIENFAERELARAEGRCSEDATDLLAGHRSPGYYKDKSGNVREVDENGNDWHWYTEAEFKQLCDNAASKPEAQIAAEIDFYQRKWMPWAKEWNDTISDIVKQPRKTMSPGVGLVPLLIPISTIPVAAYVALSDDAVVNTDWSYIKGLHKEAKPLYEQFKAMGGNPSEEMLDVPSASAMVDVSEAIGLGKSNFGATTTKVLIVGGVIAGGYVLFKYVVPVVLPIVAPELAVAWKVGK